jgi:hypothetical protein
MNLSASELRRREARECLDFDIVIAGAKKAGTSTLLNHLLCGTDVAPLHRSEMPFFTEEAEFRRGPATAVCKYFGEDVSPRSVRVGKDFILNAPEAILRMLEDSPRAQVVIVLREPVSRAHSSFWFARRRGYEPATDFGAAVERELAGERTDLPRPDLRGHIRASEYVGQLEAVYEHLHPDRVQVLLLEELHADPRRIANELLAPLGTAIPDDVAPASRTNSSARPRSTMLARAGSSPRVRAMARPLLSPALRGSAERLIRRINDVPFKPPPIDDEVRARLAAHYAPQIDELAGLLGRDLDAWKSA